MAELVAGAIVSAMLNELISFAKRAYRCKDECQNLVGFLESIAPIFIDVANSSDLGNPTCQAWLHDLHTLLVQAEGIVGDCVVKRSIVSFKYVKRRYLSSKIQDIHRRIEAKLSSEGMLVALNTVQEINRKVDCLSAASHEIDQPLAFELQDVPLVTVSFENNPFQKLRDLILSVPSGVTRTIGVKGKGGAGKTLLAKMVNNDEDIRRKYGDGSILWITIGQDVLVSSIYGRMGKFLNDGGVFERDVCGRDLEAQRTYLMEAFKRKRALVILDDIWGNCKKNHPMIYWLDICKGDGSTTLITTRDTKVLDHANAMERIEVELLSKEESWKLFSFHAFRPNMPISGEVKNIALEICKECKGLPLALKVIGGALCNANDERGWKYALSRLKGFESMTSSTTLGDELFCRLKYSYDVLDDETKKCFLYCAAFPEDCNIPTEELCSIWEAEGLFGSHDANDALNTGWVNLVTLADRSLIDLAGDGSASRVHDVMRDLAIRIIRDAKCGEWAHECQSEPGKVCETLPKIKETTKRVSFVGCHVRSIDPQVCRSNHNIEVCLLSSLAFEGDGSRCPTGLSQDFFLGMTRLLYLSFEDCYLLKELPESIKELKSLTHLKLKMCESLKELPESIKELKSLTHLDLRECTSLKELPKSIKALKFLTHLNLSWCKSLKELPESIKELKSLMHLDLSYCTSLKKLRESIKELKSLTHLVLSMCESLKELPESIKELKSLTNLNLSWCNSLKVLPESINELKSLTHLDLRYCTSFKELSESIKELKSLTHLDLSWCEYWKELPESFKELKSLMYLDLSYCTSLKELPESIKELKSLTHLDLSRCKSLKELPLSIKELKSLRHLDLRECTSLKELPESIKELKSLTHLNLSLCKSLKEFPESIKELKSLTHLDLSWCESWKELPESIKELKSLMYLDLSFCTSLEKLPESIEELKSLTYFILSECWSLEELPESIKELKSLTHLNLCWCTSLKELPESIKELNSLTHLHLYRCRSLKEFSESIKEFCLLRTWKKARVEH